MSGRTTLMDLGWLLLSGGQEKGSICEGISRRFIVEISLNSNLLGQKLGRQDESVEPSAVT